MRPPPQRIDRARAPIDSTIRGTIAAALRGSPLVKDVLSSPWRAATEALHRKDSVIESSGSTRREPVMTEADPDPVSVAPRRAPLAQPVPVAVEPFARDELRSVLRRPAGVLQLVLAERARLGASITAGVELRALVVVLFVCAVIAALPCGVVLAGVHAWKVALLYLGSVLLCSPALAVFAAYLGHRLAPLQTLALALLVAAVAALFSFGFFPILWFLDVTMRDGDWIDGSDLARVLLFLSLLAGLVQLVQSIFGANSRRLPRGAILLVLGWELLVAGITWRMARALDLFG